MSWYRLNILREYIPENILNQKKFIQEKRNKMKYSNKSGLVGYVI
jgi:hypothetical protein